jgi:hypothetical protein
VLEVRLVRRAACADRAPGARGPWAWPEDHNARRSVRRAGRSGELGADILAANPSTSLQAANARATVDLVRGATVAALAELYADMDWASADAASSPIC